MNCKHDDTLLIAQGGNDDEAVIIRLCHCGKLIVIAYINENELAMELDAGSFARSLNLAIARYGGGGVMA